MPGACDSAAHPADTQINSAILRCLGYSCTPWWIAAKQLSARFAFTRFSTIGHVAMGKWGVSGHLLGCTCDPVTATDLQQDITLFQRRCMDLWILFSFMQLVKGACGPPLVRRGIGLPRQRQRRLEVVSCVDLMPTERGAMDSHLHAVLPVSTLLCRGSQEESNRIRSYTCTINPRAVCETQL